LNTKILVIADTNVAYILYFFLDKGIVPGTEITLSSGCVVKFHPVVQIETQAHMEAWQVCNKLGLNKTNFPRFFDDIRDEGIAKLDKFIGDNLANVSAVDTNSTLFFNKRKTYEAERLRLQEEWKKAGTLGRKVKSRPSDADYSILFSAETTGHMIATNDEILLAVAQEFLSEDLTLKAEDIVNDFFRQDQSTKKKVEEISSILSYLKISFNLARALKCGDEAVKVSDKSVSPKP
jgi:hypothetical protein